MASPQRNLDFDVAIVRYGPAPVTELQAAWAH